MSQSTKQIKVVSQSDPTPSQDFEATAIFDADGQPIDLSGLVAAVADLTDRVEALEAD